MKQEAVSDKKGNVFANIKEDYERATGIKYYFGLMFRKSTTPALMWEWNKPVRFSFHSVFVFFPFIIKWFDEKGELLDKQIIPPFRTRILPRTKKKFTRVIEIPLTKLEGGMIK